MTPNATSSRMQSIATLVASRADSSLWAGAPIEPDVSTITISAASRWLVSPAAPSEVTVKIALTSEPPSGRYSFWSHSVVKALM